MKSDIVVLCNHRMAFAAIQTLYSIGRLHCIAIPEYNDEIKDFYTAFASQAGINLVLLEKEKREVQIKELLKSAELKYIFTMTFPWKISEQIIKQHPGMFYNFHYGLLPEMRGSDPVFESLRQQKSETGITVHLIEKEIDKGAIILKKKLPLNIPVTHGMLCTNLAYLGSQCIPELLVLLGANFKGIAQEEMNSHYYKRPNASDVCINWKNQDAKTIEALIRACNPWNKGAYTQWNGWNIRILEASQISFKSQQLQKPGTILNIDEEKGLIVECCNNTQLRINIVYTDEGFMSGQKLLIFGIKNGEQLASL
ncbi:formyltransferase family protein [Flavobacterium artemisiae]|uniref:Formyltransferase family protein n=1 Tax=Flavobacterium artemisiae TaxID=2126556 RepID=A0ABW4HCS9_9FLAO